MKRFSDLEKCLGDCHESLACEEGHALIQTVPSVVHDWCNTPRIIVGMRFSRTPPEYYEFMIGNELLQHERLQLDNHGLEWRLPKGKGFVFLEPCLYWPVRAVLEAGLDLKTSWVICEGNKACALYEAFLEHRRDRHCKLKQLIEIVPSAQHFDSADLQVIVVSCQPSAKTWGEYLHALRLCTPGTDAGLCWSALTSHSCFSCLRCFKYKDRMK